MIDLLIMTTLRETPVQQYERLKCEIYRLEQDKNLILKDQSSIMERLNYLTKEHSNIEMVLQEKMQLKNSLEDAFNALNQLKTHTENIAKHDEPSSTENNEVAPRSDTPLTINTVKSGPSWASMCETDSDDDASIATNETTATTQYYGYGYDYDSNYCYYY